MNDWDLVTESNCDLVRSALHGLFIVEKPSSNLFASDYVLQIPEHDIEVIGSFRIRTATGICHIPACVSQWWDGLPLGSPEAWYVAYRLMSRGDKAELLKGYLMDHGANQDMAAVVLSEPLPYTIKHDANELFGGYF